MSEPVENRIEPLQSQDERLYVPSTENVRLGVISAGDRAFCFGKNPGEDYYHRLVEGEIYVSNSGDRFCLNCALRTGLITPNRMFWQHRGKN